MFKLLKTYNPKTIRLVILALLMVLCHLNISVAQIPQFSQFYAAPLYLAPSFAGATDGSRVTLNYRNQWPAIPGTFETFAFGFDHYFHNYKSGVGILLFRDQAGSANLATTNAGILYSYNFKTNNNWTIRPGVHFLYSQRTIDYNKLVFGDQISLDDDWTPGSSLASLVIDKVGYFDASASVMAYKRGLWMGFTLDHLMTPNQSMTGQSNYIPLKTSLFGGYRFMLSRPLTGVIEESVSVTFLYKNQGPFNQLDLGAYWTKEPISIGLLYRGIPIFNNPYGTFNNDAVVMMAAIRTNNIRIGYSYDFTISSLLTSTGGSHEISIIYQFNQGPPAREHSSIPCPVSPYR